MQQKFVVIYSAFLLAIKGNCIMRHVWGHKLQRFRHPSPLNQPGSSYGQCKIETAYWVKYVSLVLRLSFSTLQYFFSCIIIKILKKLKDSQRTSEKSVFTLSRKIRGHFQTSHTLATLDATKFTATHWPP